MGFLDKFRRKPVITMGGSPIYRYEPLEDRELRIPKAYGTYAEEIMNHFDSLFPGRESFVFHEIVSDLVHIDVNVMRPSEEQDFYVLYTTGMSDMPMTLPDEIAEREDLKYAELYMFLPGDWDFGELGMLDADLPPSSNWPVQILKFLARFPHEYDTWLCWGHTMPNGSDYAPINEDVGFNGMVLSVSDSVLDRLETEDGGCVNFYSVIFAYKEEIEYKLKYGMEALEQRFAEENLPMVLDISRPNYCADFTEVLDG